MSETSVITLCIFMVVHLCGTVWWMSKVNATLGFIGSQVEAIMKSSAEREATYAKREDFHRLEASVNKLWEKYDKPHTCPNHK